MEPTAVKNEESSSILSLSFNQDFTSLGVGHKQGYKFFSLAKVPEQLEESNSYVCDGVHLVERLFQSSLVTLCSQAAPRVMRVFHMRQKGDICSFNYSSAVLSIRMNRQRLVVVLEDSVHIHHIRDLKVLHVIHDTPRNPSGLVALSGNTENCFLAYPGSETVGEVQIFDAANLSAVGTIPAHEHALAALAFDALGTRLATASNVGTVIRLFAVPSGAKLGEFSRGLARSVVISSLAFSTDSRFLAVSSNTETVHVFHTEAEPPREPAEPQSSWGDYFSQVLKYPLSYLPGQISQVWNRDRDFATARLPRCGGRNVCAIVPMGAFARPGDPEADNARELLLLVASLDGSLYCFKLDPLAGGECTLIRSFSLDRIDGECVALPASVSSEPVAMASLPTSFEVDEASRSANLSQSPPSSLPSQVTRSSSKSYADAVGIGCQSWSSDCDLTQLQSSASATCTPNAYSTTPKTTNDVTRADSGSETRRKKRSGAKGGNASSPDVHDPAEFPPFAHQVAN